MKEGASTDLPGAYVLRIDLDEALRIEIRGRVWTLMPGTYVYCGSACGPGGIGARVARHLRPDKVARWHIDRITTKAPVVDVAAHPDGDECDLVAGWLARGATVPIPGFGSSDCRNCPAHFLMIGAE